MKNIISLFLLLTLLMLSACNDSLEEIVYSDLLEETYRYSEDEFYNVIAPVYSNIRDLYGNTVTVNYFMSQENAADITVLPANSTGWDNAGTWRRMHLHSWNSEQWHVSNIWSVFYKGVMHATRIIEQLESDKIPVPDGVSKDAILAEMKAARAFYNWLIFDNFGDAVLITDASQELPEITPRSQIYQNVIDELKEAIPKLSEEKGEEMYGRFNKWVAKTLLANVYLNAEVYIGESKWDECLQECNDIINSNKYSLEANYFDNFIINNESSNENILVLTFDEWNAWSGGVAPNFALVNFTLHASSKGTLNLLNSPWGAGAFKAVPQFIDTYDPDDIRLQDGWYMGPQYAADGVTPVYCAYEKKGEQLDFTKELPDGIYTGENEGYRVKKYEIRMENPLFMGNDVPFFRYAQVLMMKAECLLRKGQSSEAAEIVTQVRQRAFPDNPDKALVTGAELEENSVYQYGYVEDYQIVDAGDQTPVQYGRFFDELGWEFAVECFRRRDLIRFGLFTTKSWLSHKPNGSHRTVFPIPQSALDANPNLVQHASYQ